MCICIVYVLGPSCTVFAENEFIHNQGYEVFFYQFRVQGAMNVKFIAY